MRATLIALIFLLTTVAMGQDSSIDYTAISNLKVGETTAAEVKSLYGEPKQTFTSARAGAKRWYYANSQGSLTVHFDAAEKVRRMESRNKTANAFSSLSAPIIEKLAVGQTKESDVRALLGNPSAVQVSSISRSLSFADKGSGNSLSMTFGATGALAYYLYAEHNNSTASLDAAKVSSIENGTTRAEDVTKLLGKPQVKRITPQGENWIYTSASSQLAVTLEKGQNGKVKGHEYKEK